jgi:hypothetical protein
MVSLRQGCDGMSASKTGGDGGKIRASPAVLPQSGNDLRF